MGAGFVVLCLLLNRNYLLDSTGGLGLRGALRLFSCCPSSSILPLLIAGFRLHWCVHINNGRYWYCADISVPRSVDICSDIGEVTDIDLRFDSCTDVLVGSEQVVRA